MTLIYTCKLHSAIIFDKKKYNWDLEKMFKHEMNINYNETCLFEHALLEISIEHLIN